jgi:1,2-diacylglycerol 3-alpha-glucosyltransferase
MRIGFFTDSYFPEIDGVTYTLKTWKTRLEERGHEVYIIYPGSSDYEPGENEIPTRSIPNPFYDGYRIPVPVGLEMPEFDIVHVHSPATLGLAGRLHAWRKGNPTVYTHHTPLEEYFVQGVKSEKLARALGKLYVPLENLFLGSFDVFTASTEKVNRRPEHVKLPVGLDMEFFQPRDSSLLDNMEIERPVAGYSGRLSDEKNVDQVLEMAEGFDGTVIVVGEGPEEEELKHEAPGNVVFRDWLDREELPGFYSAIDVFVIASEGDTLGLAPLEANACGTPVVAADNFPFNETIGEENGLRFEPGNAEDFREKVREALEGSFSPRDAVKGYSVEKAIDRLEEIYGDLDGN